MTHTVRTLDLQGLHTETRRDFRYITVRTYAEAEMIRDEQEALGNPSVIMNW